MRSRIVGGNWTAIPNAIINSDLSPHAVTLLIYRLSKPDDWSDSNKDFMRRLVCGKNKLAKVITELREAGYLGTEVLPKKDDGSFSGSIRIWRRVPVTGTPKNGGPRSEGCHYTNTDSTKTDSTKRVSSSFHSEETGRSVFFDENEEKAFTGKTSSEANTSRKPPPKKEESCADDVQTSNSKKEKAKTAAGHRLDLQRAFYGAWQRRYKECHGFTPIYHVKNKAACGRLIGKLSKYLKESNMPHATDDVLQAWEHLLDQITDKGDDWIKTRFEPCQILSNLNSLIINLQANGKKVRTVEEIYRDRVRKHRESEREKAASAQFYA